MASNERPWHANYPSPRNTAASILRQEVLQWLQAGKLPGDDYVLVDVRRNDFEVRKSESAMFIVNIRREALSEVH